MSNKSALKDKRTDKVVLKVGLLHPYNLVWPQLGKGVAPSILAELIRLTQAYPKLKKVKCAGKKKTHQKETSSKNIRSNFVIGLCEVTKALEKDLVSLLLICRSIKPSVFTQQLLLLAASRGVAAANIHGLTSSLSSHFGVKSLLALAFLKEASSPDVLLCVDNIKSKLEPICFPWLQSSNLTFCGKSERTSSPNQKLPQNCKRSFASAKLLVNKSIHKKQKLVINS